ncbi:MAG: phenylacetate--CoA ligase [Clostridiales bacterium]
MKTVMWQEDMETMPREDMNRLQLGKLQKMVKRCYEQVPYYKKIMDEVGVTPDQIKTLDDIRRLPMTQKSDLRDNYPFGLFASPLNEVVEVHASSGTTGKPIVGGYTRNDLNIWSDCMARIISAAGVTSEDIAQNSFGYGLFTGAFGLHYGMQKLGAMMVPISSGSSEKQLMLMEDFGVTVSIATPSYAVYLSELAKEMGIADKLKLRVGLYGSEMCTPEMRDQIEKNVGVTVYDNYGLTELGGPGLSGECLYRNGMHINEDHFIVEVLNPDTLEPAAQGEDGELVITPLSKEAFPIFRYRTKDVGHLIYEPCPCGRTQTRMTKVVGRTDDMLIIKGVNVFPSQIESVLVTAPHIGPHYQLILTKEKFMDVLEIRVELTDSSLLDQYGALEKLRAQIRINIRSVLGLDCKITLMEPKTIERFTGKAKRIVDLRNQPTK